jgi:fatty acid desaturase
MIETLIILIIISTISNIITYDLEPWVYFKNKIGLGHKRTLRSGWKLIDIFLYLIHHLMSCSSCISYWLTISYFYIFCNSLEGIYLGFLTYIITIFLYKKLHTTSL